MGSVQLVELNHRHMAIAEYLIQNPSARLAEISEAVGMTPSWISTVTNSELFREYFMQRHSELANLVHMPLHDKLHGVAHAAVEKLGRAVDDSTDADFVLAAADKALKHLGFGQKPAGPAVQVNNISQVNNPSTVHVGPEVIAAARAKIFEVATALPLKEVTHDGTQLPPTEGVQARGESSLGQTAQRPALIRQEAQAEGPEGPGSAVREESLGSLCGGREPAPAEEPLD